jgi:hypothetical protein
MLTEQLNIFSIGSRFSLCFSVGIHRQKEKKQTNRKHLAFVFIYFIL